MKIKSELKQSHPMGGHPKGEKIVNAWAFYDWANSVYSLVITSTIFPIYYNSVTSSQQTDMVQLFGFNFVNTALYSYALSFSFFIVALLSPLLSGIADYKGNKKTFLKLFCYMGATACFLMFFFDSSNVWFGILTMVFASIGFSGSIIFYNAYLPEITTPDNFDQVSARGYSFGYLGSSLLLLFNLSMILFPEFYGIHEKDFALKLSFILVGLWWAGFAQYSFYYLPKGNNNSNQKNILKEGLSKFRQCIANITMMKNLKMYLFAFFFYNMGVQTVMYAAVLFGSKELKLERDQLIISILIIQFVAIGGAYLFSFISHKIGNIKSLSTAVVIWIGVCSCAYFINEANGFYCLAFSVGVVMGGIQSLSRSTFSKLLPENAERNSYFSVYDITEKLAIVFGLFFFGFIEDITGSMRNSVLVLILFFLLGLIFLFRVKFDFSSYQNINH